MRARVVLWSTPGLASMKHFAILSSNTYEYIQSRRIFSSRYSFLFRDVFLQLEPTLDYTSKYAANKLYFCYYAAAVAEIT